MSSLLGVTYCPLVLADISLTGTSVWVGLMCRLSGDSVHEIFGCHSFCRNISPLGCGNRGSNWMAQFSLIIKLPVVQTFWAGQRFGRALILPIIKPLDSFLLFRSPGPLDTGNLRVKLQRDINHRPWIHGPIVSPVKIFAGNVLPLYWDLIPNLCAGTHTE